MGLLRDRLTDSRALTGRAVFVLQALGVSHAARLDKSCTVPA